MQQVINDVLVNFEYLKRDDNTIVFLHGWGGSLNSFKAAFDYFNNNSNYSLLNLDLPAFGKSETPKKIFTIYDYYEIVLRKCTEEYKIVGCAKIDKDDYERCKLHRIIDVQQSLKLGRVCEIC